MNNTRRKQTSKYTHPSLTCQKQVELDRNSKQKFGQKTKRIGKLQDKKAIRKKQPSALRMAAINETFHKIENNTNQMIDNFKINKCMFNKCITYTSKVKCKCDRNIKYYCLKCMYKNPQLEFPSLKLPLNVRVIHHNIEKINKSSIIPISFISQQVQLEIYDSTTNKQQVLENFNPNQTYVLFPHKNSQKLTEKTNINNIKNVVILDCTWFQTDQLLQLLTMKGFTNFIRLENYQSLYWRYNHHNDQALSSAESLIYFFRQYQQCMKLQIHEYDDLMFLYCLNLKIVENNYRKEGERKNEELNQNQHKN